MRTVTEVRDVDDGRAYRMMYTTVFPEAIYVLCAFEKKSTHGIGTPERWLHLVEKRWRDARTIHESAVRG